MNIDWSKLLPNEKFVERTYRSQFNTERFSSIEVKYKETDLWIGVDPGTFRPEMNEMVLQRITGLRDIFDRYIAEEPMFRKSLQPFQPSEIAPAEAMEMAEAAAKAGIGPMSAVAGLFAREAGKVLTENFDVEELIVENGGDIFAMLKNELILSVFAGESPLSERIGMVIPAGFKNLGICTSAGKVGPSMSFGKADAVMVICEDVVIADAYATAFGNKVKSPASVEKVIHQAENIPELLSLLIICDDKIGIRGDFDIKILK